MKIHIKDQPTTFEHFGVQWTPTIQMLDAEGVKRHQFEGFLPVEEFLGQLKLGIAHSTFARGQWQEAERLYREIVETLPHTDAAPQAMYWAGVAKYKGTGNAAALGETAKQFQQKYTQSPWAKKASVWAA